MRAKITIDSRLLTDLAVDVASAGVGALIRALREKNDGPPIFSTRRVDPAGEEVEVELHDTHFGK